MEELPLMIACVVLLGIAAQWLAWRLRLPSILLLLGFGFAAGQFVHPDDVIEEEALFALVSLAVAIILLEGGLSLKFRDIEETRRHVLRLCTVGVAVAWGLITLAAARLVELDIRLAALLGAVLVVTGPTVIGPLLRHIKPVHSIGAVARWEGIVVDPIGAVLAVLVFQAILASSQVDAATVVAVSVGKAIIVGGVGGFLVGKGVEQLLRHHLVPDFLHSPVLLAVALTAYALSNHLLPEVGLLTVTVLGVTLANQRTVSLTHIFEFKENLSVLLISSLFIVLGARVELDAIVSLGPAAGLFLAALIVVARPASVVLSTFGAGLSWPQRGFLSFLAPRGIVAAAVMSVFASKIASAVGDEALPAALADDAAKLVPLTFVVIISTVSFYGLLAGPLARWLGLAAHNPQGVLFVGAHPWVVEVAKLLREAEVEVMLIDRHRENVGHARMAGLPVVNADVLSRYVSEELELFGIGRLVAVTPDFEVNTLACQEFIPELGRRDVYQVRTEEDASQRTDRSHRRRGRPLFAERFTYETIERLIAQGARAKRTQITEKFTFDDFKARYGEDAVPMFTLDRDRRLTILTGDSPEPAPGSVLIGLIREPREDEHVQKTIGAAST